MGDDVYAVAVVVHPYVAEERGQKLSLHRTGRANIEALGAFQEIEICKHSIGFSMQLFVGGGELLSNAVLLNLYVLQAIPELDRRECSVGGEIDESLFLHVELLEFRRESTPLLSLGCEQLLQGSCHVLLCVGDLGGSVSKGLELPSDRPLHLWCWKVRKITHTVLSTATEKVFIHLGGMVFSFRKDETVLTACAAALSAVEHAPEKMIVNNIALTPLHSCIDHLLDPLEKFGCDQRFVAPWE